MTSAAPSGRIITFYSYKGGTGRSMAMANVAWVLASSGKRVLAVDWDLEAPGLHRYFHPFLVDKDLGQSEGVIDLVFDYATEAASLGDTPSPAWIREQANILRYASSLQWEFPRRGTLDFIPAGRQSATYSTRVNAFDWKSFYERLSGGAFIEALREQMRAEYDFVLIDSRTGVSDTSGICTVQLPDALVVCFTLNNQGIDGAAAVATSVQEQRGRHPLTFFPVPTRIDSSEKDKLEQRWGLAQRRFAPFLSRLTESGREAYWRDVAVPYVPYYGYEELLAPFGDRHRLKTSHTEVWESLTRLLAPEVPLTRVLIPEEQRQRILSLYEGSTSPVQNRQGSAEDALLRRAEDTFAELGNLEQTVARNLFTRLVRLATKDEGGEDTRARLPLREADAAGQRLARVLAEKGLLSIEAGDPGEEQVQLADVALMRWGRLRAWMEEDREFLLWRQRLRGHMQTWERGGRDSQQLSQDLHLAADAERWKDRLELQLNPAERAFIEEARKPALPATHQERYDAFLSYAPRHSAAAGALRLGLEQFLRPRARASKVRIFDSAVRLGVEQMIVAALGQALGGSEYFILLASPEAARSRWVQWELNAWIGRHGTSQLLIVLVEGDIVWDKAARDFDFRATTALPPLLQGLFREEPDWCDVRHAFGRAELSLDNPQFQEAVATLAAAMYHLPKQDLMAEESRQRTARTSRRFIALAVAAGLTSSIVSAGLAYRKAAAGLEAVYKEHLDAVQLLASSKLSDAEKLQWESSRDLKLARDSLVALAEKLTTERAGRAAPVVSPNKRFVLHMDSSGGRLQDLSNFRWLPTPKELLTAKELTTAAFNPDGRLCATASSLGGLWLWSTSTQKVLWTLRSPEAVMATSKQILAIAFSPDGTRVAAGFSTGQVEVWNLSSAAKESPTLLPRQHSEPILALRFATENTGLIAISSDRACGWNLETARETGCISLEPQANKPKQQNEGFSPVAQDNK